MEGKLFVTILGLLLAQILAALLMGMVTGSVLVQLIIALVFAIAALLFLYQGMSKNRRAALPVLLAFSLGFLNVVYLSFLTSSMWLVIMLCLDAAGFILALDLLDRPPERKQEVTVHRRRVLEKELPRRSVPRVEVYQAVPAPKKATKTIKKRATRRATKKTAPRRVVKKKVTKR